MKRKKEIHSFKIIFPFVGDSFGGSHKSSLILIQELASIGHNVKVILHKPNSEIELCLKNISVKYEYILLKNLPGSSPSIFAILLNLLKSSPGIISFMLKEDYDIIHGNDLRINLTWGILSKLLRKKFVWHQRTVLSNSKKYVFLNLLGSGFIAISNFVYQSFPKKFYRPLEVIPNPIEIKSFDIKRLSFDNNAETIKCLYLGRVVKEKNIEVLLKAIKALSTSQQRLKPRYVLNIVGKVDIAYKNELNELLEKQKIKHLVTFHNFTLNTQMHLTANDIIVSPGLNEGLGRSLLEGMSMGLIGIASNSGAHKEIITPFKNGFLFDPLSSESLASTIKSLSKYNIQDIQNEAFNFVKTKFNTKEHASRVDAFYRLVVPN